MPLTKEQEKQLNALREPFDESEFVKPGEDTLKKLEEKIAEHLELLEKAEKTVQTASEKPEPKTPHEVAEAKKTREEAEANVSHIKSGLRNSIKLRDKLKKEPAKPSAAGD
jgi:anion-transporting  ArsA/GET3 family ATPase